MTNEFSHFAPISFLYERDTPSSNEISTNLKQFFGPTTYSNENWLTFDGLSDVSPPIE